MHLIIPKTLEDLEIRLLDCTGPDRALDLAISQAFERSTDPLPHYTGSIDSALNLGRALAGLNMVKLHARATEGIQETGAAFVPVFARSFCLEVVRMLRERQDALPVKEKS